MWCDPQCIWQAWTSRQPSMRQGLGTSQKLWRATIPMGALCRLSKAMCGIEGQAMFECVESNFSFNRCLRQGRVEAPRLWQRWPRSSWQMWRKIGREKRMGVLSDLEGQRAHQICSFMWADNFWIVSHPKKHLEQTLRDLMQEAEKWDLAPKPASLWWTSTFDSEEKSGLSINTKTGRHRFPFDEKFKILGCTMTRRGKSHEGIEERMQFANKA